ncbi:MAG TPA: coproporphyrinogen-III oxidase family protein [Bacteriovoracaceae bacterium]|nr:coproporphyrinogen-III oxidase family protein [Bacteriovoracaceae bacterium]
MTQVSSLYLHVPFCMHLCNYCDFYKRKFDDPGPQIESFHQFLLKSFSRHEELLKGWGGEWKPLETIYLGGGTPSLWGPKGARFFKNLIHPIGKEPTCEFTMEVDPGTWSEELIDAWKEIGLNRISIGTQTLNPEFLQIMDRAHSIEESLQLLEYLQKNQWNFSLDFLLGLPFSKEKLRDIKKELDQLLQYSPTHISLYILNARSKYPHVQSLPDDDFIREEYLLVSNYLRSKGFHHYEVSNFALPGFESLHNQRYWRGESVAALGPTGTGFVSMNKNQAVRYKWKVSSPEAEIEHLGERELSLERTYLSLRTSQGVVVEEDKRKLYATWEAQEYVQLTEEKVKLTALGFLMLDSLMDDLFKWETYTLQK